MIENVKKISNPLTIIAIFAGLAEISGTVVLPFLDKNSQSMYIWFLMVFPILLVGLFFLTLNFNHKVLYAPSDFQNEDNFIKLFDKPTAEERLIKLNSEIEQDDMTSPENDKHTSQIMQEIAYRSIIRRSSASTYYLAGELVITKLSQEFDEIEKDVMLRSGRSQFLFDAIGKKESKVYAIEVKYLKDNSSFKSVRSSLVKIQKTLGELPQETTTPMILVLAVATDLKDEALQMMKEEIEASARTFKIPCEVRVFNLEQLENELLGLQRLQ